MDRAFAVGGGGGDERASNGEDDVEELMCEYTSCWHK